MKWARLYPKYSYDAAMCCGSRKIIIAWLRSLYSNTFNRSGCCKGIEKMQKSRLDGSQLPITQLRPKRFIGNLQHRVRQSFLHHNIKANFLFEQQS